MKKILSCLFILFLIIGCEAKKEITGKKRKDTLVYAQAYEPTNLNPQGSTEHFSQVVTAQIFDRLLEIDQETGGVVPGLAEKWDRVDEFTLILYLKKGVKFHNGESLKSSDVKFTLERAKLNKNNRHLFSVIKDIDIIDEYTVKISTEKPCVSLINNLSHKSAAILSESYYKEKGENYFETPVGTGPYKFISWIKEDKITLEANDDYFKGKPAIKNVIIKVVPKVSYRVKGLESGEFDIIDDIATNYRATIVKNKELKLIESPGILTNYIGFSNKSSILKDKEVRRAFAMGIDRDFIIEKIVFGNVKTANSFIAPVIFGYSKDSKVLEYDPKEAKKIIESKGLVGSEMTLITNNTELRKQIAENIKEQLSRLGIKVTVKALEWNEFLDATAKGEADIYLMGWGPSTYDGHYALYTVFHSSQFGAPGNRVFYSNPKVDQLLDDAIKELDVEKRRGMYTEVLDIINEDVPALPLYQANIVKAYSRNKKLEGVEASIYPEFYKYSFKE